MDEEKVEIINEETIPSKEENGKKVKKPKSKTRRIIEWVLTGFFVALFIVFGAGQIDSMIHKKENYNQNLSFGYGSFVIRTDSMEPKYKVGTAIITHKDDPETIYKKYQEYLIDNTKTIDMTFMDNYNVEVAPKVATDLYDQTRPTNMVMTHRLREVIVNENVNKGEGRYIFIVSGINVSEHQSQAGQYQAFTEKQILGVVKVNSVFLGGFYSFISSPWGLLVFLLIPAFYLVITSVLDIFKAMREKEAEEELQIETGGSGNTPSSLDSLSKEDRERLKKQMLDDMLKKKGDKK